MLDTIIALLVGNPILLIGLDLLAKSTFILLLAFVASQLVRTESFTARSQHLLWLAGLVCLALIPLASTLSGFFNAEANSQSAVLTLPAPLTSEEASATASFSIFSSNSILILLYLCPCLVLLARMVFALANVFRIGSSARDSNNIQTLHIANNVAEKVEVSRLVRVLYSKEITSPFSYGIFSPKIVLPDQAGEWSESTLEDVLVHEFTHIKRFDWPSTLICHFIASLYWINPLCWMAVSRISEEAENSCDSAVLEFGKNNTDYAKSLMLIARQSRDGHRLLTQMMADNRILSKRIQRILKGKNSSKVNKAFLPLLSTALLTMIITFGNVQIIALEPALQVNIDTAEWPEAVPSFEVTPRFILN